MHDYRSCDPCVSWSRWWEEAEATDQDSECEIIFLLEVQQILLMTSVKPASHVENLDGSATIW